MLKSSVIILATVHYAFAELVLTLRTISLSNGHDIYPKDKHLRRKSVMLRFQYLIKMKIFFITLYSLIAINLVTLKAFAYSVQLLNTFYRQKGLMFLYD